MAKREKITKEDLDAIRSWRESREPATDEDLRELDKWKEANPTMWKPDKFPNRKKKFGPEIPYMESAGRGFSQAVTLDHADELTAQFRSIIEGRPYEELIEEEREKFRQAEEANPGTSFFSRLGGYAVPSAAAARLLKPATRFGRGAAEGALGAIQGGGESENQQEVVEKAIQGAGLGVAGEETGRFLKKYGPVMMRKLNQSILGTPEEVTSALVKDPNYLDDAMEADELLNALEERLIDNRKRIGEGSEKALAELKGNPIKNKQEIMDRLEELPDKFDVVGVTDNLDSAQAIMKEYQQFSDSINKAETQRDLKRIIRNLDEKTNFDKVASKGRNDMKRAIRKIVDDVLKKENPKYAELMKPVAKRSGVQSRAIKNFNIQSGKGQPLAGTERSIGKIESLKRDFDKPKARDRVDLLRELDLAEDVKKSRLADQSTGGNRTGSRNVDFGGYTARAMENLGVIGQAAQIVNPTLGMIVDTFGRNIGSALARTTGRMSKPARETFERVRPLLKGGNQMAVHQMLSAIDPEYNEMIKEVYILYQE